MKSAQVRIGRIIRALLLSIAAAMNFAASKPVKSDSPYAKLMNEIDIYQAPEGVTKLISLQDTFRLVRQQGVEVKLAKETYNLVFEQQRTQRERVIPSLGLTGGGAKAWNVAMVDSNPDDVLNDRLGESKSTSTTATMGLNLNSSPLQGVIYSLALPQLSRSFQTSATGRTATTQSGYDFTVNVALLKDNPLSGETLLQQALRIDERKAKEQLKKDTITAMASAQKSFFDLIQKYLQLTVQRRSLEQAKALEVEIKEKIAAGEAGSLEAVSASLQTSQTETELMSTEMDYESAIEEFKRSLSIPESDKESIFPDPKSVDADVDALVKSIPSLESVRKSNSELSIARLDTQRAKIDADTARNTALPQLGFSTNYKNGLPSETTTKAISDFSSPNDRGLSVSLNLNWTLINDPSKQALRQALLSRQKSEISLNQLQQSVDKNYKALSKRIEIGRRRLKIAKVSRQIAEEKLNSEYQRFQIGESQVKNLIDSQTALNGARISEISSRIELLNSISELRAMAGMFPEDGLTLKSSQSGGDKK
jgi:outer membrane protein TolC